jgi:hypothetical protein
VRIRRSLTALLAIGLAACVYSAAGSGFAIDKSKTFLGGTFTHGDGTDGVHEAITATAIRRGLPRAPGELIGLVQAGAENVDVTHHFDSEYHFDSASTAAFPKRFDRAFATVHAHLAGAAKLADRNPEFFDPSYPTFRHIAQSLAAAMRDLAAHPRCDDCDGAKLRAGSSFIERWLPALYVNENPDPHHPTNPESVWASQSFLRTDCGLCGKLWPVNKAYRSLTTAIEGESRRALTESTALPKKDPLRARIAGIRAALRAYRAFQALGHAFHATQDFFAHSNYVELMAGVQVAQPVPAGTRIPVPGRRGDWSGAGLKKLMGAGRYRMLESGAANAIWLGEGDYCLGSAYNPRTKRTVTIPASITKRLGLSPIRLEIPAIGTNPRPPAGLRYCHYPTSANPGLNKDEPVDPGRPRAAEPSFVNHPFARQAAEDMTAVLWKSFLASVRRPGSGPAPGTPKPKPPPTAQPGTWSLKRATINPFKAAYPAGSTITVKSGSLTWQFGPPLPAEFVVAYKPGPGNLAPGTHSFTVTVTGRLTGAKNVQRYLTVDAILLVGDRWDGSTAAGTLQSCTDPIGTEPISCTPPSKRTGTFKVPVPTPSRKGETFTFGVGALNCSACYVRYEYVSR